MSGSQLLTDVQLLVNQLKESLFGVLPNFIVAVLLLVVGVLLAKLVRAAAKRFIGNLDRFIPSKYVQDRLRQFLADHMVASLVSRVLYWITILFFITLATETLRFPVVTTWLSGLTGYLPRILSALLVVTVGYFGGALLKDIVIAGTRSTEIMFAATLGKLVHGVVFFVSVIVAVDQIGIDVTFLTTLLSLTLAALLFATGLSFGLGARQSVSNILASYNLRKIYKVGQMIRVGDIEGRIVRITVSAVIIDSQGGQMHVPAKLFDESVSVLMDESPDAGK